MWSIYHKEIRSFLNSLIAYLVMIVFVTFIGVFMWLYKDENVLDYGYADMDILFSYGPLAFFILIPAITMRSFAEEKRDGTLELLLTKPISDWQLVVGKYLACLSLVLVALIPTLVYYFSIYSLGKPSGNIDTAAVFSSYLGLMLLGAVFTGIGVLCSSLSDNQIISFVFALVGCYLFYDGLQRIGMLDFWGSFQSVIIQLGLMHHYQSMSKGMIDFRNVFYFISLVALLLAATRLVLGSRKWQA